MDTSSPLMDMISTSSLAMVMSSPAMVMSSLAMVMNSLAMVMINMAIRGGSIEKK